MMHMRMGILGGTFDPVHYGHLLAAEACRESLQLQQVRFIPAAASPHKPDRRTADGHARADMIQLAIAGCPEFLVDAANYDAQPPRTRSIRCKACAMSFPMLSCF